MEPCRDSPENCIVTIVSQMGTPSLLKLDVNWNRCLKLKLFIEELSLALFEGSEDTKEEKNHRRRSVLKIFIISLQQVIVGRTY